MRFEPSFVFCSPSKTIYFCIAIVSIMDGGTLERVTISNIIIEGTIAPLFMRLGNRARPPQKCDPKPPTGIFRDVSISNVVATGASKTGCVFSGLPGHPLENISLSHISIAFAGGGSRVVDKVPELEDKYPESTMFGPLPAYGFYFRHVKNVRLHDVTLTSDTPDARPSIAMDDAKKLKK